MNESVQLNPTAQHTLARWHQMVEAGDLSRLPEIVAQDAVFRSPTLLRGFETAPALVMALQTVITVLQDFTYHRSFADSAGNSVALEFSASVRDKQLKGLDIISFGDDGKIAEVEVLIRPLNALQALYEEMSARLGEQLVAFKGSS